LEKKDEAPKRCDVLRLRNMLLKATFPSSYLGLVEATLAALKKWNGVLEFRECKEHVIVSRMDNL